MIVVVHSCCFVVMSAMMVFQGSSVASASMSSLSLGMMGSLCVIQDTSQDHQKEAVAKGWTDDGPIGSQSEHMTILLQSLSPPSEIGTNCNCCS